MFSALGSQVTLDRVAPAGAAVQGPRGRGRARGRVPPAGREAVEGRARDRRSGARTTRCSSRATTAARSTARTRCLCIGSIPNTEGLGCEAAGVEVDDGGYVPGNRHCQTNVPHIYSAGDVSGRLPLSSVAAMQGRKIAEHVMGLTARAHRHLDYDKAAQAIFTDPEIAEVGVAEAEAFAAGPQAARHQGAVLVEPEGADQRRHARLREDPLRSRDRRRARRRDRRAQRGRADLGDRGRGDEPPEGRRHRRLAARAPRARRSRSPTPRPEHARAGHRRRPGSSGVTSPRRCSRAATPCVGVDCFTPYYDRGRQGGEPRARARRTPASSSSRPTCARAAIEPLLDGVDVVFHQAAQAGRAAVVVGRLRRLRRPQRARDAAVARSGASRRARGRGSCTRRRRRCTATSRATRRAKTDLPKPFAPYGVTKLAAEHLCGLYAENWGVPTVSLRYFTVFGPRQRPDMSIHRLCEAAVHGTHVPALRRRHARSASSRTSTTSCAATCSRPSADVAPGTYVQPRGRRRDHALGD